MYEVAEKQRRQELSKTETWEKIDLKGNQF